MIFWNNHPQRLSRRYRAKVLDGFCRCGGILMRTVLILAALLAVISCGLSSEPEARRKESGTDPPVHAPNILNISISSATTYVTEPKSEHGLVDFAAAINEKFGNGVTSENNAAIPIYNALGPAPAGNLVPRQFFEKVGMRPPPEAGAYFVDITKYAEIHLPADDEQRRETFFQQQVQAMVRPWRSSDFPDVARWLSINRESLKLVVEGTLRSRYFSPVVLPTDTSGRSRGLIAIPLSAARVARHVASALKARAMLHLGESDTDAAWSDLLAAHRLGRFIGTGPTVIEALVGFAIDAVIIHGELVFLQHSQPDAESVRMYLRDLDRLPPLPEMAEIVNFAERLTFVDSTLLVAEGGAWSHALLLAEEDLIRISRAVETIGPREIDWDATLRAGNDWYDRLAAAMRLPKHADRNQACERLSKELEALRALRGAAGIATLFLGPKDPEARGRTVGNMIIGVLLPASISLHISEDRARQRAHNLRVAFALSAFRSDHGRYPQRLSQLRPHYLPAIPTDLFSDSPLVYRITSTGYLLYSVGPNRTDDDGRDVNAQPPGDDLPVEMPISEHG